ncbi:MAG: hypothetical protein IH969_07860 [Candidatus Krumholzibacteriota bacterium]|nr:hypothetical protein [Candidatus Krumholzibacteriota bacterium]
MSLKVNISAGELLDKITILEIKSEQIQDPEKLKNVRHELDLLRGTWSSSPLSQTDLAAQIRNLKRVNKALWDIEDRIRLKEAARSFDDDFIYLARSVYKANDERAAIKRDINRALGSELVEEKSYPDYSPPTK